MLLLYWKLCHLECGGGANWGTAGVSEWLGAVEGGAEVGVVKLEKHVEIDVTVGQIQTLPDAWALRGQGPQQSHPPVGRDSPGRRAKRCQMWRKPPGSLTPSPSNTVSIVQQHMLPVKGEKCRHQHMPEVFQA